jgi:hypothetical protein
LAEFSTVSTPSRLLGDGLDFPFQSSKPTIQIRTLQAPLGHHSTYPSTHHSGPQPNECPKDELEAMIAAQLLAAHNATMECYRRAMIAEQTFEGRRENLSQANKLSRTYAALVEALNRHRGKGQQKVTVEHVHVHAGGQAVVGVIGTSGGGDRGKLGEQPHEKQIGYAPEPALQSPDSDGEFVSIARDDQRALPDARGNLARRSEEE